MGNSSATSPPGWHVTQQQQHPTYEPLLMGGHTTAHDATASLAPMNNTVPTSSLMSHCLRGGLSVLSSSPPMRHHHPHLNQNDTHHKHDYHGDVAHNDNNDRLWRANNRLGHTDLGIDSNA
jgi:hypothetical protein